MTVNERIDALVEELIGLDEIAGSLDPESNTKIDADRKRLRSEIDELLGRFAVENATAALEEVQSW